jgi:hypothetical protein
MAERPRNVHKVAESKPAGDALWTFLEHGVVISFCFVFSLVDRRRSETAFCDNAGPAPPRASHMTRCRDSALVTHARVLHLVTLLDERLTAGWSFCPTVLQNPVRMTRRMTSNRQDDTIHGHPGDRSSISCHSGGMGHVTVYSTTRLPRHPPHACHVIPHMIRHFQLKIVESNIFSQK